LVCASKVTFSPCASGTGAGLPGSQRAGVRVAERSVGSVDAAGPPSWRADDSVENDVVVINKPT
jgi:hypothetical protein